MRIKVNKQKLDKYIYQKAMALLEQRMSNPDAPMSVDPYAEETGEEALERAKRMGRDAFTAAKKVGSGMVDQLKGAYDDFKQDRRVSQAMDQGINMSDPDDMQSVPYDRNRSAPAAKKKRRGGGLRRKARQQAKSPLGIRGAQAMLHAAGIFKADDVDGKYGPKTYRGIIKLQKMIGAKPDGVVGPKTTAKYRQWSSNKNTAQSADKISKMGNVAKTPKQRSIEKRQDPIEQTRFRHVRRAMKAGLSREQAEMYAHYRKGQMLHHDALKKAKSMRENRRRRRRLSEQTPPANMSSPDFPMSRDPDGEESDRLVRQNSRADGLGLDAAGYDLSGMQDFSGLAKKKKRNPFKRKAAKQAKLISTGKTGGVSLKQIQKALGLKPDGKYGPKTYKAIRALQKKNGMKPDGLVGGETLVALRKMSKGIKSKSDKKGMEMTGGKDTIKTLDAVGKADPGQVRLDKYLALGRKNPEAIKKLRDQSMKKYKDHNLDASARKQAVKLAKQFNRILAVVQKEKHKAKQDKIKNDPQSAESKKKRGMAKLDQIRADKKKRGQKDAIDRKKKGYVDFKPIKKNYSEEEEQAAIRRLTAPV